MENNPKTPGVYIQELDAFGNSVVPSPTAIPAFIGYTAQTTFNGSNLINKAVRITSLAEFRSIFGSTPPQVQFELSVRIKPDASPAAAAFSVNETAYDINNTTINYRLYSGIKFFYQNGGRDCYIMSIGAYDYTKEAITNIDDFIIAIDLLKKELEPTMLVIPDLIEIHDPTVDATKDTYLKEKYTKAYALQSAMINHCGEMQNRIAILDIPGGFKEPQIGITPVQQFRNSVEPLDPKYNSFAAAYYPWLHTSLYQTLEISYKNINETSYPLVIKLLHKEFTDEQGLIKPEVKKIISAFSKDPQYPIDEADYTLKALSKSYQLLMKAIASEMNLIAPSAGIAGVYTSVDNERGVWKAPANIVIQSTISPSINIDHTAQEDLNVPINGKSICAIRAFPGMGNLVWGARTLDGNSNDWRYVNVIRTLIFIEQSVKNASMAYTFASNNASTWTTVQSMISAFLTDIWKQGGLVGSTPDEAFSVLVGLGATMTTDDILNGIMKISILVAVSRPAEFIEISYIQEMQKG